ncbi:MAG: ASKHA domain-containing protein [Methanomassiliicoccaceae archaeon]|nr:ASKHA domain-containing protein [Methanomassiliicoccaceae archaeon]
MYIAVSIHTGGDITAKFRVRFVPQGVYADADEGTLISDAAKAAGVNIKLPCNGNGRCGRCNVVTVRPNITDQCNMFRVLACQTHIDGDMTVEIQSDDNDIIASNDHRKIMIDDLSPVVTSKKNNFGLAVDIGTTTVAVSLVDMNKGIDLYSAAGYNGQGVRGDDVLSRIEYAHDNGTEELRRLVVETINDLIDSFEGEMFTKEDITAVYISGNTTMTHLFLGIDPSPIREPPYEPVIKESEITGKESRLNVNKDARVICMPSPAAYVGGDVTSDIISAGMDANEELSLLIDVGTNGEVALGNKDIMLLCSSSAGPAFEGGKMTSGMMARPGAIDSFRINDDRFEFTVIAGSGPKGICGSGLIDILAQLFINGHIDKKGRFTDKVKTRTIDGRKLLTITDGVYISEDDIRNAVMTKAAIYSASTALIRGLGVNMSDIQNVYIAGGFGNFINTESAITIGMLPDIPRERFVYLGNASLAGAKHALLSSSVRKRISDVFERMTYVDLSSAPAFSDEYMSALFIPHTDLSQFPTYKK